MPFDDAYSRALGLMQSSKDHEPISSALDEALKSPSLSPDVSGLGGGWTAVSALGIALCVFKAALENEVKESSRIFLGAVLHSGKSDTIGALVGQLLAAHFGPKILPKDWLSHVEARGTIEGVASDLFDAWIVETQHELDPYPAG
jgi:ADP-ribosylglycohydrolase